MNFQYKILKIFFLVLIISFISFCLSKIIVSIQREDEHKQRSAKRTANDINSFTKNKIPSILVSNNKMKIEFLLKNGPRNNFLQLLKNSFNNDNEKKKFSFILLKKLMNYKHNNITEKEVKVLILMLGQLYHDGLTFVKQPLLALLSKPYIENYIINNILIALKAKGFAGNLIKIYNLLAVINDPIILKRASEICEYYKDKKCIPFIDKIISIRSVEFGEQDITVRLLRSIKIN